MRSPAEPRGAASGHSPGRLERGSGTNRYPASCRSGKPPVLHHLSGAQEGVPRGPLGSRRNFPDPGRGRGPCCRPSRGEVIRVPKLPMPALEPSGKAILRSAGSILAAAEGEFGLGALRDAPSPPSGRAVGFPCGMLPESPEDSQEQPVTNLPASPAGRRPLRRAAGPAAWRGGACGHVAEAGCKELREAAAPGYGTPPAFPA